MLEGWSDVPSYDQDKIYASGMNKYGASRDTHINFTPEIRGAMASVTSNKTTDYENLSHFVRDAVVHRLHYWHKRLPEIRDRITVALIASEVEATAHYQKNIRALLDDIEAELKNRHPDTLDITLDRLIMLNDNLPPQSQWRNECEFLIDKYDYRRRF